MEYITGAKTEGCVFCKCSVRCDEFVLYEGRNVFVMMNRYPYVSGHLMIIPNRHVGKYEELTQQERKEMFNLLETALKALREAMNPSGFNVGMNIGKAAGADTARAKPTYPALLGLDGARQRAAELLADARLDDHEHEAGLEDDLSSVKCGLSGIASSMPA